MSVACSPSLLVALRAGTRDLHHRTEAAFILAEPSVTRAEYVDVLAHLLAFYTSAECALAAWAPALAACGLHLATRRRTPMLRRDLQALESAVAHAGPPSATEPPIDIPDPAHAVGTLYVLEGATLGGQLLGRRLGPALGLTADHGLTFFTGSGDVGLAWRTFGEALGRFEAGLAPDARAGAFAGAVAAARATFVAFERRVVAPTARAALAVSV